MRRLLIFSALLVTTVAIAAGQDAASASSDVRVEPAHLDTPRPLAEQTEQGVIRDYLTSWKAMRNALEQNQPGLLNADFVGTAKDKLTQTIQEQRAAGIHTRYRDRAHDLQIVFYSPDGLSIELVDNVDYDVQVFDQKQSISTQQAHARYVVLLTPAEVRWRVRVLEAE